MDEILQPNVRCKFCGKTFYVTPARPTDKIQCMGCGSVFERIEISLENKL